MRTSGAHQPKPPPRPPRSPAVQRRVRRALTGVLTVGALGAAGFTATVLVAGSDPSPTAAGVSPAGALPAPSAANVVGAPSEVASAEILPATPLPDESGAELTGADGTPLPAATADGVNEVYTALEAGDMNALEAAYAPVGGSASWAAVDDMLQDPEVRAGLQDALRTAPTTRDDVAHLYSSGGYRVGVDDAGGVQFVRAP